jgi:SAM-dependent methyltransferase
LIAAIERDATWSMRSLRALRAWRSQRLRLIGSHAIEVRSRRSKPALTLSVVSPSPDSVSCTCSEGSTTVVYQSEMGTQHEAIAREPITQESIAQESIAQEPMSHAEPVRLARSAGDWVSFQLHREALERFVPRGSRVLESNAGAGQYTEVLHQLGCRVSVQDESLEELALHQAQARALGYEGSVEGWAQRDLCSLSGLADASFDAVVAYGAALSYTLERRDRALTECIRVLRPRGVLVVDVLSLWGTMHRHLPLILGQDLVQNRAVIRSGNAAGVVLGGGRQCHLFRAAELEAFLRRGGLELLSLSASSALSTCLELPVASDPSTWSALLEYERAACVERGYLDSGTQLIAVARR